MLCKSGNMRKMLVYTERFSLIISKEQKEKLEEIADKKLVSMNDIIRLAIDEYLRNHAAEVN